MRKLPFVKSTYPDEVHMIGFKKILKWDYNIFTGFQYDYITDTLIEKALSLKVASKIDINIDWEDDNFLHNLRIKDELKHPLRIAALINTIRNGGSIVPVDLDTLVVHQCCSCIANGHHRLRSLQYLQYTHFPAYCSGYTNEIRKITDRRVDKLIPELLK